MTDIWAPPRTMQAKCAGWQIEFLLQNTELLFDIEKFMVNPNLTLFFNIGGQPFGKTVSRHTIWYILPDLLSVTFHEDGRGWGGEPTGAQ